MAQQNKLSTNTQIRNMYSDTCYLNMKFYNTKLSFQVFPANGTSPNGIPTYDLKNGIMTTVDIDGAFSLYKASMDIINEKINEVSLKIDCNAGAFLALERKIVNNAYMTSFTINKNGNALVYVFKTQQIVIKENGQVLNKTIESGLGGFAKTIDGYLTGINADRHLDKLTDEFAKNAENNSGLGYQKNQYNGYQKKNNNRQNYRNNYNYNNQQQDTNYALPNQQNMGSYQLPF